MKTYEEMFEILVTLIMDDLKNGEIDDFTAGCCAAVADVFGKTGVYKEAKTEAKKRLNA